MKVNGAQLMTRLLADAGVEWVAGIPGHTVFPFANAVPDQPGLKSLLVRHEAIAAFAADVYFRLSGNQMAVFMHSIPGVSNAAAGIANAFADSSTMLLIAGETASDALGRGAYQELSRHYDADTPQMLRVITKHVWQARTPLQLVERTLKALKTGPAGRPGPTVVDVFQEAWESEVDVPDWPRVDGFLVSAATRPTRESVERATDLLRRAERPLIVAGNGVNLARAQDSLVRLAERLNAPVVTTVSGKGAFPEDHPLSLGIVGWVGTACANFAAQNADLVLSIGSRMTESTTSSWQPGLTFNLPGCTLIQSDISVDEIATVFPVDAALVGDAREVLEDLLAATARPLEHRDWLERVSVSKRAWREVVERCAGDESTPIKVGRVVAALRRATESQPVSIVCDIGKHHKWLAQQFEVHHGDAVVSSMGAGTMGIGPCGAVGAALARPDARTIAWTGDGGLSMTPYVLATAAEYRLPILFVVIDDEAFGAVANIQQHRFGRTVYSEFTGSGSNPDYRLDLVKMAEASGVPSRRVVDPRMLDEDFRWALQQDGPVLLDIMVDRQSLAPEGGGKKLSNIWDYPIYPWADAARPSRMQAGIVSTNSIR